MEEIRQAFPNFVPNQVLSSGQLNALREYLDQQNRLSRVRLSGTGIVCGLEVERPGNAGPVVVNEGFGISSDGYLIELPASRFTHYRVYKDPGNDVDGVPSYDAWKQRPTLRKQIGLLELLESQEKPGVDKALTAAMLDGRVVILYLEISEQDLRTCLVTDCNNNGSNLKLNPHVLLVKEEDLTSLQGCGPAPQPVVLPRLHTVAPLTSIKTTALLNNGYAKIIESVLPDLTAAIELGLDRYDHILSPGERSADPVKPFERVIKRALERSEIDQYHYDLVADVATAFNEFIVAACRWIPDCAAPTDHSRHLMLGHLSDQGGFRHHFRAATMRSHWQGDLARVAGLLQRLMAMLVEITLGSADEIQITPSHGEGCPLGQRAIPHYFKFDETQLGHWRPDDCCTPLSPWSYRGQVNEIDRAYRRCSLLRIEGHTDKGWSDGRLAIAKLRRQHNAEFNLLVLYLEGPGKREKKAFELLAKERVERGKAETALIGLLDKTVETAIFKPSTFKRSFTNKTNAIRVIDNKVKELELEWIRVRAERKPLCNLGHLEADYGAARTEILCVFHRLLSVLEANGNAINPHIKTIEPAERESGIREAAENHKELSARIEAERDAARRKKLEQQRAAAEAEKINLEAEGALLIRARKSTSVAMARTSWSQPETVESLASKATENIKLVRDGNSNNTVQLAQKVSLDSLREILQRLMELLSENLAAFNLPAFLTALKQLAEALIELRLTTLVKIMIAVSRSGMSQTGDADRVVLEALSESLKLEEQDMQQMLLSVLHDCRHSRLIYLYHLYLHHRQYDNSRFADFASRHPGMEHLAGVKKGGTFVLVAEGEDPEARIVADFALHGEVSCCCEPPETLCLPPVAMPDYRSVHLRLDKAGDAYLPVELNIDVLTNDYDPNEKERLTKGRLRRVELLAQESELGAELRIDRMTGLINYRLEVVVPGAVDRFGYRLKIQSPDCSGEDVAQVLVLLVPEIKPETKLGAIAGRVTWYQKGESGVLVEVQGVNRSAITGPNGLYTIENLDAGTYTLRAVLWGGEVTSDSGTVEVVAGETAQVNFDLPEDQQANVGNLDLAVFDGSNKEPVSHAMAALFDANQQLVAQTDVMNAGGIYKLDAVPVGSYKLGVGAEGFYPHTEDSAPITAGGTTTRSIALAKTGGFMPAGAIEFVAVKEGVTDLVARKKVAEAYAGRQAGYMTAIATAGSETSVRNSSAYSKSEEFVIKTLQDPSLTDQEVINAYTEVSKDIAASVKLAGEANKDDYRALLENVSMVFMDRVSLSNPEEVTPEAKKALIEMNNTVTDAGIDVNNMRESWKGEELGTGLGLKSTESVSGLVRRR